MAIEGAMKLFLQPWRTCSQCLALHRTAERAREGGSIRRLCLAGHRRHERYFSTASDDVSNPHEFFWHRGRVMSTGYAPVSFAPARLLVRCFAEFKHDQWQAFSIEFGLAAQGDTLAEVEAKIDSMIQTYLEEALVGQDREHAGVLLRRKAPLHIRLRYHYYSLLRRIRSHSNGHSRIFDEPLSLCPPGFVA